MLSRLKSLVNTFWPPKPSLTSLGIILLLVLLVAQLLALFLLSY